MIEFLSVKSFVLPISILAWSVNGATLSLHHRDSADELKAHNSLMRRDIKPDQVTVAPDHAAKGNRKKTMFEQRKRASFKKQEAYQLALTEGYRVQSVEGTINICDDQFEQGPTDTNDCPASAAASMSRINDSGVCLQAAQLYCPDTDPSDGSDTYSCVGSGFLILNASEQQLHPLGCFMRESDNQWFYNPSGLRHNGSITGIPICIEPEFANGTAGSRNTCPVGYSLIDDEYTCRSVAECQDLCTHQQFRVINSTEEDAHPKGCHRAADSCVQFNNKTGGDPTCGVGSTPCTGFPICKVTTPYTGSNSDVSSTIG